MEIKFNMTPEQQAADDARARAYAGSLAPEAYKAALADLKRPQRRAAPAPGAHVSTLTPAEAGRELRRLGVNRRSVWEQHEENRRNA